MYNTIKTMSFLSSTGNMNISVLTQFLIKGDAFNFIEVIMRMWVDFLSLYVPFENISLIKGPLHCQ